MVFTVCHRWRAWAQLYKLAEDKIVVGSIVPGGSAERDGRLKLGDQLLAVALAMEVGHRSKEKQ